MTQARRMSGFVSALLAFFCAIFAHSTWAYTQQEIETFDNEPPYVRDLLVQATDKLSHDDMESAWQAANLYCEASRYGSAEGMYRLGMLYAFGHGVPTNKDYAANLFGLAARQGHFEAQKMLDTIEIRTQDSPQCIAENVPPEKGNIHDWQDTGSATIDHYIANLPSKKRWVVDLVENISDWYKVDPKLVLSIITAESNFKVAAKSNKEAQGLMQLIPSTAERFNVKNAYNASQNIKGGVKYLRWLLSYFRGDVALTVAAYNAGEGSVDKYKGIPPYKETKKYVKKVMGLYQVSHHEFDENLTSASPILKIVRK
jgi:soluble lytic murein transglycosylase-like protein